MLRAIRAGAAMLALIAPAAAQAQPRDEWQFGATIYGYFPDISVTTRFAPAGGGGEFTLDIGTILDNLKFAFMGAFEAHSGRLGRCPRSMALHRLRNEVRQAPASHDVQRAGGRGVVPMVTVALAWPAFAAAGA